MEFQENNNITIHYSYTPTYILQYGYTFVNN